MIIQGHPDILLGPQGLNGLHGFGLSPSPDDYVFPVERDFVITPLSAAYLRFLPENGGQGLEQLYKEIRDFLATNPTQAEIEQAMRASGVEQGDIDNAFAQQPPVMTDAQIRDALELAAQAADLPTGLAPIPDSSLRNREIIDYVMTHSDAEILAAMATTGVTQSDIIRAFASFDPTMPNGQSPAYARSLPENGGAGIADYYKQINDYVNSHSFYEVLSQMFVSEVSRADLEAANSYAFEKQQSQTPAEYAAAQVAIAAAAAAAAAEARRLADFNALIESSREQQLKQQGEVFAEAKARAAAAAAVVPTKVFTATGQSPAYTRFLPESGGKGIPALYKEISDFVAVSTNAEIQTAMTASGVSEVDVINALQVFPNRPIVKTTETVTTSKDTGLALPLVVSAIAAFFVLG